MIDIELISNIILLLALIALLVLLIEGTRVLISLRKVLNRVDLLTDIKGWLTFFKSRKSK